MFALFSNFLELLVFSDGTSSSFSLYNELWRKSAFCFLNIFSVRGRVWGRTKPYVLCLDPICFYVSCKTQMVWEWWDKHFIGLSMYVNDLGASLIFIGEVQRHLVNRDRAPLSNTHQNPGNRQSSLSLSVLPQETEAKRSRHRQAIQSPASSFPQYLFWTSSHRMVTQAPPKDSHKQ